MAAARPARVLILGGGVTGLAAGAASGRPVYEAADAPGGLCSSYYVVPKTTRRLSAAPADGNAYRFDIGGGHWIFGGDPMALRFIASLVELRSCVRRAGVYFPDKKKTVPYPIQNHLAHLGWAAARSARGDILSARRRDPPVRTMEDWLRARFGETLSGLFFEPFHELYTAGLWKAIAPQDGYKSPDKARGKPGAAGYNATFSYPVAGLNALAGALAARCDIHYGKRVVKIDARRRLVHFAGGQRREYDTLLNTLPLNRTLELAGLSTSAKTDPYTSVLVINIGAVKASRCPEDHWVYIPRSRTGFHRVGFYSHVDSSFLPRSARQKAGRVSIYVEKAYVGGRRPAAKEAAHLCRQTVRELQEWGFIGETEVVDPTWIDVAYTWSWPGSAWRREALELLRERQIHQIGRYGRWIFQGIADSVRDGLMAGYADTNAGNDRS